MTHTVEQSWERILSWFEEHCPTERLAFRGPATEEDLHAVQQATGRPLPADQLTWWRLSDGADEPGPALIPTIWRPVPVAEAMKRRQARLKDLDRYFPNMAVLDEASAGTAAEIPWLPSWLPIAAHPGGGHLFLDLREGPMHGCIGEMDKEDVGFWKPVWPSVTAMLAEIADALVNGTAAKGHYRARVEDDSRLYWCYDREAHAYPGQRP